ncbi:MAG: 4'-phosphopantetheinyl transferase superfamily protein [Lewinellaceae bacterium]|nr:4'-phosphopantetheinyl transferase superfamily protein [Lewinellaceae bacterium]
MAIWLEKNTTHDSHLGIWKIEEPEDFFLRQLDLEAIEENELARIKGRRRLEWLASRLLVHQLLERHHPGLRLPVVKDDFGKPHTPDSHFHLSYSHSHEFVAAILAHSPTGIDIQFFVSKISAIAPRFMNEEELASLQASTRLEHAHFYWCIKEALFKAYGRKALDFRQSILVQPFDYQEKGKTVGQVCKDGFCLEFEVWFERDGEYFLAYCL